MTWATELIEPVDTNSYTRIPFQWNYDSAVDFFRLYYGRSPGQYTAFIDVGNTNAYEFSKTNWVEELDRHWYSVSAFLMGNESEKSNEVFWPLYPSTHYSITWTNPEPMTIVAHTNMMVRRDLWPVVTRTDQGQTNYQDRMPGPVLFFQSYRTNSAAPELLKISVFNPLNP